MVVTGMASTRRSCFRRRACHRRGRGSRIAWTGTWPVPQLPLRLIAGLQTPGRLPDTGTPAGSRRREPSPPPPCAPPISQGLPVLPLTLSGADASLRETWGEAA